MNETAKVAAGGSALAKYKGCKSMRTKHHELGQVELDREAKAIQSYIDRGNANVAKAADHYAKAGERLLRVKERVGHGQWLPWLQQHFSWSEDTAERYVRIYECLRNSADLRNLGLPIGVVDELSKRNTPEGMIDSVIKRAKQGETFTQQEVRRMKGG